MGALNCESLVRYGGYLSALTAHGGVVGGIGFPQGPWVKNLHRRPRHGHCCHGPLAPTAPRAATHAPYYRVIGAYHLMVVGDQFIYPAAYRPLGHGGS